MSPLDELVTLPGEAGDVMRQRIERPPLQLETPEETGVRQAKEDQQATLQKARQTRIRGADLAARGIPTWTDQTGDVQPVTDESGSPLTMLDRRHGIAYDSSGMPKAIQYGESGAPTLRDPFEGLPLKTDKKTGDQYQVRPGLPWKWVGQDPDIAAANAQKTADREKAHVASLLGRKLTLEHADEIDSRHQLKEQTKEFQKLVPGFDLNSMNDQPPDQVLSALDQHFNNPYDGYGSELANSRAGWFDNSLSPEAMAERKRIDQTKATAMQKAQQLLSTRDRWTQASQRHQETAEQARQLEEQRLQEAMERAGMVAPQDQQQAAMGADEAHNLAESGSTPEPATIRPELAPHIQEAKAGNKLYDWNDQKGVQVRPEDPLSGFDQAVNDGLISQEFSKQHRKEFIELQEKRNQLEKDAGGFSAFKAMLRGGGLGAAFLAGAGPGAAAGGEIGSAFGPAAPWTVPIGTAIGGLATGTLAAFAARKGLEKLGEYSDLIKSLNASAELHPLAQNVGELAAFGSAAPKALAGLARVARIAKEAGGTAEAVKAVSKIVGSGAAGGLVFEGALRPTFDAARYVAADQLGIPHDPLQMPDAQSLVTNAALGVLGAAHSVRFRDVSASEIASIMTREKIRRDAGIAPDAQVTPEEIVQAFQQKGVQLSPDAVEAMAQPLSRSDMAIHEAVKAKLIQMERSGQLKGATPQIEGATQAQIPRMFGEGEPITTAAVGTRPIEPKGRLGGEPEPTGPTEPGAPAGELKGPRTVRTTGPEAPSGEPIPMPGPISPAPTPEPASSPTPAPRVGGVRQVTPEGVSPHEDRMSGPHVIATGVKRNGEVLVGPEWNTPHDGIGAYHGMDTVPEEQRGFIVRDDDGTQRFARRDQGADIAREAGQASRMVRSLQSEDLRNPSQPALVKGGEPNVTAAKQVTPRTGTPVAAPQPERAPAATEGAPSRPVAPTGAKHERAVPASIDEAAHQAATSPKNGLPHPTEAQKQAGNYQMGHTRIGGLDISIENPAGSQRRPEWPKLKSHYGYIRGSEGKDGDHIDAFIKPSTPPDYRGPVFVINQQNRDGGFDEHKAVIGASDAAEAERLYRENYDVQHETVQSIARFNDVDSFKRWATGAERRTAPAKGDELTQPTQSNATQVRNQQGNREPEHRGVPQGRNVRPNAPQVREGAREQAGRGSGLQQGAGERPGSSGPKPASKQAEVTPSPETQPAAPVPEGTGEPKASGGERKPLEANETPATPPAETEAARTKGAPAAEPKPSNRPATAGREGLAPEPERERSARGTRQWASERVAEALDRNADRIQQGDIKVRDRRPDESPIASGFAIDTTSFDIIHDADRIAKIAGRFGDKAEQWIGDSLDEELTHHAQLTLERQNFGKTYQKLGESVPKAITKEFERIYPELASMAPEWRAVAGTAELERAIDQLRRLGRITEESHKDVSKFKKLVEAWDMPREWVEHLNLLAKLNGTPEAAHAPAPKSAASDTPTALANTTARDLGQVLTVPKGATMIRATDSKGRATVLPLSELKGANVLQGAGPWRKLEAGTRSAKGEFVPMEERIEVRQQKLGASVAETPRYRSLWIDRSGNIHGSMNQQAHADLLKRMPGFAGVTESDAARRITRGRVQGDTLYLEGAPTPAAQRAARTFAEDHGLTIETQDRYRGGRLGTSEPDELGFYSQLERVVQDKIPNRATPQQILATLDPAKSGHETDPDTGFESGGEIAVHSVSITPEMRRAVMGGQRLFASEPGAEPEPRVPDVREKLKEAYKAIVKRTGFPAVEISELAKRSGVPLDIVKPFLLGMWRAGRANFALGDRSLATPEERAGAVQVRGEPHMLVRIEEPKLGAAEPDINSPQFKRWFGRSKVVDKNGKPLRVYHGGGFDAMEHGIMEAGDIGIHFGTKASAQDRIGGKVVDDSINAGEVFEENGQFYFELDGITYSKDGPDDFLENPGYDSKEDARAAMEREAVQNSEYQDVSDEMANITEAYLKMENPIRLPDLGTWGLYDVMRNLPEKAKLTDSERERVSELTRSGQVGDDIRELVSILKSKGYDGIVYRNQIEDKGNDSYIVFDSNQVKSAEYNSGEYDPNNPNILFASEPKGPDPTGSEPPSQRNDDGVPDRLSASAPTPPKMIDAWWKRMLQGARWYWEGTSDVFERHGYTELAEALRKQFDVANVRYAEGWKPIMHVLRGLKKTERRTAEAEWSDYFRDRENGRPQDASTKYGAASPAGKALIDAWKQVAKETGARLTQAGVEVRDGDHWRPIGNLGENFFPRKVNQATMRVLNDRTKYPAEWNKLVQDLIQNGNIQNASEAERFLKERVFTKETDSDYFANIERARRAKLPESWLEYDFSQVAPWYVNQYARRMGQIEAYGQPHHPGGDLWQRTLDSLPGSPDWQYTQEYIKSAEEAAKFTRSNTTMARNLKNLQAFATGTFLSNPMSSIRNLVSGTTQTAVHFGAVPTLRATWRAMTNARDRLSAHDAGILKDDLMAIMMEGRDETTIPQRLRHLVGMGLELAGFNVTERVVRTATMLAAQQHARKAAESIKRDPGSRQSLQYIAFLRRHGIDAMKVAHENASGPETAKFVRAAVNETQGSYTVAQVPLVQFDSIIGFLTQFQKWGTQMTRFMVKHGINPAVFGTKRSDVDPGTVGTPEGNQRIRDFRPLLYMLAFAVGGGELLYLIKEALTGKERGDASWEEIRKTRGEAGTRKLMERITGDIINSGTLGILTDYAGNFRDFTTRGRVKNPLNPPGVQLFKNLVDFLIATKQQKTVTLDDLNRLIETQMPGLKVTKQIAGRVMGDKLKDAQNVLGLARSAGLRMAKDLGLKVVQPFNSDTPTKTPESPFHQALQDALFSGDVAAGKRALADRLRMAPPAERQQILKAARASVTMSQPIKVGGYASAQNRTDFLKWAVGKLPADDLRRITELDRRYWATANAIGLGTVPVAKSPPVTPRLVPAAAKPTIPNSALFQGFK